MLINASPILIFGWQSSLRILRAPSTANMQRNNETYLINSMNNSTEFTIQQQTLQMEPESGNVCK